MSESSIQLYYWKATLLDGTEISQYDEFGNCVLTKNLCEKGITFHKYCNPFTWFEKKHGRVRMIGWYPFTKEIAQKAMSRNEGLRIATSDELKPIEQVIPQDHYAAPTQCITALVCTIIQGKDGTQLRPDNNYVKSLKLIIVPRNNPTQPLEHEFQVEYS